MLTKEKKLELVKSLNWDHLDKPEDMLAVVEGRLENSAAFDRARLFVRSMERLSWYAFIELWGVETVKKLYTPELAKRVWPKGQRIHYDFAIGILRGENPCSTVVWGKTKFHKSKRFRFFEENERISSDKN